MPRVRLVPVERAMYGTAILWEIMVERSEPSEHDTNISHKELPTRTDHENFVVNHPFWLWYLIMDANLGKFVGQIRVSVRNEIGIGILKRYRRKGYATAALEELMATVTPQPYDPSMRRAGWVANINPKNSASVAFFEKHGFHHIQNTYLRDPE